ncbi:hypothetical protein LTR91_004264 [Friedmanniomyces endolithicus]|uniref:Glycoprotease family protein n=1 Tax=Friedmanniomyces endolithicus TaxID=329885 RepID=A0AAN6KW13_9PEZI|nr:hypothetical protein LTR38_010467 [Friedmanniomyces endolithicus]KAK0799213.1 hypothetical protein LTR59_006153 [Friedmanniomyces endolithicus]KAK0814622.1 hypothetical protein LTR75_004134 [Friedmanniomyces endolithicus]KAK0847743.1 hypothetical protein LTR03_006101 [Friedmanniomyces endolithicus]KAK0925072.1 hypothetical protein LTR57_005369 [Friedmanniomyces endolithicus]
MSTSNSPSRTQKRTRSTSKRGFHLLASTIKPDLAVDTSFNRHQAQAPKQVFPYESKTQESSSISFGDLTGSSKDKKGSLRRQLENRLPIRPFLPRSVSEHPVLSERIPARPAFRRLQTAVPSTFPPPSGPSVTAAPLHKRIKGLRPSSLDLSHEVSPSDRAITIGLAVPFGAAPEHTASPQSGSAYRHHGKEVQTPTIIITPAKEDFDISYSPEEQSYDRPASSLYSRYTNCAPRQADHGRTPPVPPLPLFVNRQAPRNSARTVFEEDTLPQNSQNANAISVCTLFEDDDTSNLQPRSANRLTSQSHLSTPRRSRGWWNIVTSPFSATSHSNLPFWRSPGPSSSSSSNFDEGARLRILDEPSSMGTSAQLHSGELFTDRTVEVEELRSALPLDTGSVRPVVPKRSDTAPGALDTGGAGVNIYRVPSQGLAAGYYDVNRRFPSLVVEGSGAGGAGAGLNGWSPSWSVARKEGEVRGIDDDAVERLDPKHDEEGPFADVHETTPEALDDGRVHNVFTTPSEQELQGTNTTRPAAIRNDTNATLLSNFSPLTATPTVEDAHIATFMGPQSTNGELREVQLTPARVRSPPEASSVVTPASYATHNAPLPAPHTAGFSEKAPYRPSLHTRTDSSGSRGLGMTDGEKELYPPPKAFVISQPRLGTDRFGQLTIRGVSKEDRRPYVPWYRRMLWPLAFTAGLMLVALVVLLVMFIPQAHHDMAVEAEWLNLTGFPPLPTGVATVIQPRAVKEASGCVRPGGLWSCAMPSGHASIGAGPDFRFEIRFRNGTLASNTTQLARRSAVATAHASDLVRRDSWAASLFAASPAVPSRADQQFLGQYTDNVSLPYEGEQTPFYISLLDPVTLTGHSSIKERRQSSSPYPYPGTTSTNTTTNATTTAATSIPRPALRSNGRPAPLVLYPYAGSQPLRLFNRGQDTEHYGFYTYFDRSLLVSNLALNTPSAGNPAVATTSTPLANASAACTFAQTRLHVQLWTRRPTVSSLGGAYAMDLPAANTTANDMAGSGSFPYPVTVTLDRHGGQAKQKGVYCYGLDQDEKVLESAGVWVDEDRGFGGGIVNAAAVPGSGNGTAALGKRDGEGQGYGGIDGGAGGCSCQWRSGQ